MVEWLEWMVGFVALVWPRPYDDGGGFGDLGRVDTKSTVQRELERGAFSSLIVSRSVSVSVSLSWVCLPSVLSLSLFLEQLNVTDCTATFRLEGGWTVRMIFVSVASRSLLSFSFCCYFYASPYFCLPRYGETGADCSTD